MPIRVTNNKAPAHHEGGLLEEGGFFISLFFDSVTSSSSNKLMAQSRIEISFCRVIGLGRVLRADDDDDDALDGVDANIERRIAVWVSLKSLGWEI